MTSPSSTLPEGRDPADLIAQGRHAVLREALAEAIPLAIHLVDQHFDTRRLDNSEVKWHALRATTAIVLGITDPELRATATKHIAERLDWDTTAVENGLTDQQARARTTAHSARDSPPLGRALQIGPFAHGRRRSVNARHPRRSP